MSEKTLEEAYNLFYKYGELYSERPVYITVAVPAETPADALEKKEPFRIWQAGPGEFVSSPIYPGAKATMRWDEQAQKYIQVGETPAEPPVEIIVNGGSRSGKTDPSLTIDDIKTLAAMLTKEEQITFYQWLHDTYDHCRIYK